MPILSDPTDEDTDDDGLTDEEEYYLDTISLNSNTDGDGLSDGTEVDLWFDPTNANPDGDSYNDKEELANDTSPFAYNMTFAERGDAAKAFPKIGRFIEKYADDAPKVAEAIMNGWIKTALNLVKKH